MAVGHLVASIESLSLLQNKISLEKEMCENS